MPPPRGPRPGPPGPVPAPARATEDSPLGRERGGGDSLGKRRQKRPPKQSKKRKPRHYLPQQPRRYRPDPFAALATPPAQAATSSSGTRQHLHINAGIIGDATMVGVTVKNARKAGILIEGRGGGGVPATPHP